MILQVTTCCRLVEKNRKGKIFSEEFQHKMAGHLQCEPTHYYDTFYFIDRDRLRSELDLPGVHLTTPTSLKIPE